MKNISMKCKRIISMLLAIVIILSITPEKKVNAAPNKSTYTGDGFKVVFNIDHRWKDAFHGTITLKNTGTDIIENWTLGFNMPYTMKKIRNGVIKSYENGYYVIKNKGSNQDIGVGKSVSFAFTAKCKENVTCPNSYDLLVFKEKVSEEKYRVDFKVTKRWSKSFHGQIKIKNISSEPIEDWTLEFNSDIKIDCFWKADIVEHKGNHYIIKNKGNNSIIGPGKSLVLTFRGTPVDFKSNPADYELYQITSNKNTMAKVTIVPTTDPMIESATTSIPSSEKDTDLDGLSDYTEYQIGTNANEPDTDGDGLSDGLELYYLELNPLLDDTDHNRVRDGDEDFDDDGLTNKEEVDLNVNPLIDDSDCDGIKDGDEVHIYHTNPLVVDTDQDRLSDYEEIKLGLDPLKEDTDGNGITDNEEKIQQSIKQDINEIEKPEIIDVSVSMNGTGYINSNTKIENSYRKDILSSEVVGLIGVPIEIKSSSSFEKATITFHYDPTHLINTKEEDLRVMWYDQDNDRYVIMDNESIVDLENNTVSYTTTHFSTYLVVDRKAWYEVWSNSIIYRNHTSSKTPRQFYDFCFVIDSSYIMSGTNFNTLKEIINNLVGAMYSNDRVAFIEYNDEVKLYQKFDTNKNNINNVLNGIATYDCCKDDWLTTSLNLFDKDSNWKVKTVENKKMIILLSNGDVEWNNSQLQVAIDKGIKINVILVNSSYNNVKIQDIIDPTGGTVYIAKKADEIRKSMFGRENEVIGEVELKDTDGDKLPDIYETSGMIISNGTYICSNPQLIDTDKDGITDAEEMGILCEYEEQPELSQMEISADGFDEKIYAEYFSFVSNPNLSDSDFDGCSDVSDVHPLHKTMQNFLDTEIYYIGYNNYALNSNGTSVKVSKKQETEDQMFRFVWCGKGYKITPLNGEKDNKVLTLSKSVAGILSLSLEKDKNLEGQIWEVSYFYDYNSNGDINYHDGLVIRNRMLDQYSIGKDNTSYYLSLGKGSLSITKNRFSYTNIELYSISKKWTRFGMLVLKYGNFLGTSDDDVERAMSNYTQNVKIGLDSIDNKETYLPTKDKLVLGQHLGKFNKLLYGDTTMSAAGCGLIATYNAMTLADYVSDDDVSFFRLAAEFEYNGLTSTLFLGDGTFGSSPIKIDDCFKSYNVKYKYYNQLDSMDKNLRKGKSGMLLVSHIDSTGTSIVNLLTNAFSNSYAHYFAVTNDSSRKVDPMTFINHLCSESGFTNNTSITSALTNEDETFWFGYILN